jgi:hypothetical protein
MDEKISEMKNKGICWHRIHLELIQKCKKNPTFEDRQRLAIDFYNCFSQSAGIEPICPKSKKSDINCLDGLNSASLQTYNDFLIQVDKDCHFYSKDNFNQKVSKNVNNLVLHSNEMTSSTNMVIYNSNKIKESA